MSLTFSARKPSNQNIVHEVRDESYSEWKCRGMAATTGRFLNVGDCLTVFNIMLSGHGSC